MKNIKWGKYPVSFLLSVLFHFILFFSAAYLFSFQFKNPDISSVYLSLKKNEVSQKHKVIEQTIQTEEIEQEDLSSEESSDIFYNLNKTEYDTSEVKQIYKESTLNVSVRYPGGWTYIDQNVKNKLDGVTFWSVQGNYEVPPYVHLEVKDKYIFNPSRWEHKLEHNGNIYYYNNPEELKGYFTQIIYIRTDSDEDYSLKLMVKGKENFQSFQPVFFSMAKSFSFGNSFL